MKITILMLTCFVLFFGCKQETEEATSPKEKAHGLEVENVGSKIENFDCATFFESGYYSSLCFVNSKSPKFINTDCIFDFEMSGDKQEESLKLQFTEKNSAALAEIHFNMTKTNYKKGQVIEVGGVGDAAFFDVHGTDMKSLSRSNKDLHVRYQNLIFVIMAEYKSDNDAPCFYADIELLFFARAILSNL